MGKVKRWQIRNIKTAYKALYLKCRKSDISIEEQNKILNEFFDETYYKISEKILDGWLKRWFGKSQRVIEHDVTIPKDVIVRYKQ